jgi:uncharacterized membrane protein YagU involved in acid resistance
MSLGAASLWALAATLVMTTIFEASHGLGFSRLNLPLVFGSCFTARRARANVFGILLYLLGGWLFALGYLWAFDVLGLTNWKEGFLVGFFHGVFLLVVVIPLLPYVHPRMATEYDSPTSERRLEPPGFIGLNYGVGTPLTTLVAHGSYGLVLSIGYLLF